MKARAHTRYALAYIQKSEYLSKCGCTWTYTLECTCRYTGLLSCKHVLEYGYMYIQTKKHAYVRVYTFVYVYLHISMYACIYTYIHVNIYAHTHAHASAHNACAGIISSQPGIHTDTHTSLTHTHSHTHTHICPYLVLSVMDCPVKGRPRFFVQGIFDIGATSN
jgi:hypothetical protein